MIFHGGSSYLSSFLHLDFGHDNDLFEIIDCNQVNLVQILLLPVGTQPIVLTSGCKEIIEELLKKTTAIGLKIT